MSLQSYKELDVWKKSIELVQCVYALTEKLPHEELYGLKSQMRRAAISIPSNIAEGQRRKDLPEFLHFLRIADASSAELETQIIICKKLYGSFDYSNTESILEEVQKMLNVLIRKLKTKNHILKTKSGFTLIEVLVVVTVGAVITVGGFVMFSQYRKDQNVKLTTSELSSAIREVQRRSVTQQDGKQWGIRFSNSVDDTYQTWSGLTYASGTMDQTYNLKRGVQFGNPPSGSAFDFIFQAVTGIFGEKKIISVTSGSNSIVGDIILNTLGKSTTRIERGLVGYWHFDEGTSTVAYDASGNGNSGTLTNGPTWQSGTNCKAGNCLSFDGTDDYVIVGNDKFKYQDNFSVSAFFKITSLPSNGGVCASRHPIIYNHDYGYNLLVNNIGRVAWQIYNTSSLNKTVQSLSSVVGASYFHAVGIKNGTTITLYINGVFQGENVLTSNSVYYTSHPFVVGGFAFCGGQRFYTTGTLDEVRVYNRALSAQEVLDMYNDLK